MLFEGGSVVVAVAEPPDEVALLEESAMMSSIRVAWIWRVLVVRLEASQD